MRAPALILSLVMGALVASRPCHADSAQAVSAPAPSDSLPVLFVLENTTLTSEALRLALEQELRVRVSAVDRLESTGLSIHVQRRRAKVTFTTDKGESITRTVELSGNDARSSEIVALLAGNLARDQASELLSRLTPIEPEKPEPAAQPEPEPAPEPESKPEPPPPTTKKATDKPGIERKKLPAPDPNALLPGSELVNLSLYHPITVHAQSERRRFKLELGAAYSRVGAIEGFGLTLGYLRVTHHLQGVAVSLGLTRIDGDVEGAQLSALVSEGHGKLRGYEGAAVATLRWADVEGAQTAGLISSARDVEGFQGAAAVAVARDVRGAQAAVVPVGRDVEGAQLGIVSVARDVNGLQAGVVTVARTVDLQIGLINIAERVDGAAIGLVTIAGNGRVQPAIWGTIDSDPALNGGVRFVAGYAFSQLGGGVYTNQTDGRSEAGGGLHLGWESSAKHGFLDDGFFELGAHVSSRYLTDGSSLQRIHYRAGLGLRLFGPASLLAAVEANHDLLDFGTDVKAPRPVLGLTLF